MSVKRFGWVVAAGLLALGGCTKETPAPTVHEAMTMVIVPESQTLWDVANKAINDNGEPDASKVTEADWAQIVTSGQKIKAMSERLAAAKALKAAAQGEKLQDQDNPGAADAAAVQGFLDADPAAFAEHARKLAAVADNFVAAAQAKDAVKLGDASSAMDEVCEQCHVKYWYPNQATQTQ